MVSEAQSWKEANKWEAEWHGNCVNSYNEETKQYIYAKYMGMDAFAVNYYGQRGWDFGKKSLLDVGCGPYSMLLKCKAGEKVGIDPCEYPSWVYERYKAADIKCKIFPAESMLMHMDIGPRITRPFDEVFLYNCLQHTESPSDIIRNIREVSRTIRVFEWIDHPISPGHLHELKADKLNEWLGGTGKTGFLNEGPVVGKAYWGVFKGNHYGR